MNLGLTAMSKNKERDLKTIADIIRGEHFDVVALQEVLSEGKAFWLNNKEHIKKSIIMELGGSSTWGFEWAHAGGNDPRQEGYAFIWNKRRIELSKTEVTTPFKKERVFKPRMLELNRKDLSRQPYYGRFTAKATNVEFRLICVHTYFGNDDRKARSFRQSELNALLEEIYPQIADKRYGNPNVSYTILLGDYNAELLVLETMPWLMSSDRGFAKQPAIMNTDLNGVVESKKYKGRKIKTVQYEPTTLKKKVNDNNVDEFAGSGFACSYDHFSFEEEKFNNALIRVKRIRKAVTHYCKIQNGDYDTNFEKYYKTVSDHIPIAMDIEINTRDVPRTFWQDNK